MTTPVETAVVELRLSFDKMDADLRSLKGKVEQSARQMETSFQSVGSEIKSAFSFLVAGFVTRQLKQITMAALELAEGLSDASSRLGIGVEALQELRFAAEISGVGIASLEQGIARLSRTMGDARAGNQAAVDTFREVNKILGRDILANGAGAEKVITDLAAAFEKVEDPARKLAIAQDLIGRDPRFIQLLNLGVDGLDRLKEAAHKSGAVLSGETVAAIDKAKDALDAMGISLKAITATLLDNTGLLNFAETLRQMASTPWDLSTMVRGGDKFDADLAKRRKDIQTLDRMIADLGKGNLPDLTDATAEQKAAVTGNTDLAITELKRQRHEAELAIAGIQRQQEAAKSKAKADADALLGRGGTPDKTKEEQEKATKAIVTGEKTINELLIERAKLEGNILTAINEEARARNEQIDAQLAAGEIDRPSAERAKQFIEENRLLQQQQEIEKRLSDQRVDAVAREQTSGAARVSNIEREIDALERRETIARDSGDLKGIQEAQAQILQLKLAGIREEERLSREAAEEKHRVDVEEAEKTHRDIRALDEQLIKDQADIRDKGRDQERKAREDSAAAAKAAAEEFDPIEAFGKRMEDGFKTLDVKIAESFMLWQVEGKSAFESLGRSFITSVEQVIIQSIAKMAILWAASFFGGPAGGAAAGLSVGSFGNIFGAASGGRFTKPSVTTIAEQGPETVFTDPQLAKLVAGTSRRQQTIVQVFNSSSAPVTVKEQRGATPDINMIRIAVGSVLVEDLEGGGQIANTLERRFGVTRRGV